MLTPAPLLHLRALRAVLEAARETLAPCSSGGRLGIPACDKPAIWTFGSPTHTLCKLHGREHEGRHDVWPLESRAKLVAAIAAYDAVEDALPDLTGEQLGDEGEG